LQRTSVGCEAPLLVAKHLCWLQSTSVGCKAPLLVAKHLCWLQSTSVGLRRYNIIEDSSLCSTHIYFCFHQ
jgi:hypothetical protein